MASCKINTMYNGNLVTKTKKGRHVEGVHVTVFVMFLDLLFRQRHISGMLDKTLALFRCEPSR